MLVVIKVKEMRLPLLFPSDRNWAQTEWNAINYDFITKSKLPETEDPHSFAFQTLLAFVPCWEIRMNTEACAPWSSSWLEHISVNEQCS